VDYFSPLYYQRCDYNFQKATCAVMRFQARKEQKDLFNVCSPVLRVVQLAYESEGNMGFTHLALTPSLWSIRKPGRDSLSFCCST
jgi:hypothetical protein